MTEKKQNHQDYVNWLCSLLARCTEELRGSFLQCVVIQCVSLLPTLWGSAIAYVYHAYMAWRYEIVLCTAPKSLTKTVPFSGLQPEKQIV